MSDEPKEYKPDELQILIVRCSPRRRRLAGAAHAMRVEVHKNSTESTRKLINEAVREAYAGDLDIGWRLLHAAGRQELLGLEEGELDARAQMLRPEIEQKLKGWRKDAGISLIDRAMGRSSDQLARLAITKLREQLGKSTGADAQVAAIRLILDEALGEDRAKSSAPVGVEERRTLLWCATWLRDEGAGNDYARIGYVQFQLAWLLAWLVLILVVIASIARPTWFAGPDDACVAEHNFRFLLGVLAFGALAGALSAILSLARESTTQRLPDQISDAKVTFCRPFIGAALGLAAYVLLRAGVLSFVRESSALILAISFAAGFTERLVVGAIENLAAKKP